MNKHVVIRICERDVVRMCERHCHEIHLSIMRRNSCSHLRTIEVLLLIVGLCDGFLLQM